MFTSVLNVLQFPSLLMALCLVLVLYQLANLLRVLALTRRSWLYYLPLLMPAGLAFLAFQSLDAPEQIMEEICGPPNPTGICPIGQLHWTADTLHSLIVRVTGAAIPHLLLEYWVFILLLLVSFCGMLLVEYKFLPRVPRPPVWQQYYSRL
ncbi:MAG TPA: hypothetical protein VFB60_27490 [Ktedonobacteraceae bacterium]|nr:hypothetical protein [Ktedonobacteraceae bacterium]